MKQEISSTEILGKINSHNEWDKLREIIVGSAEGSMATLTWSSRDAMPEVTKEKAYAIAKRAHPRWFLDEVAEDLKGLCDLLQGFGVKVHRPQVYDLTHMYASPFWASTSNNSCS